MIKHLQKLRKSLVNALLRLTGALHYSYYSRKAFAGKYPKRCIMDVKGLRIAKC